MEDTKTHRTEQIRQKVLKEMNPRPGSKSDAALVDRMVELIIRETA